MPDILLMPWLLKSPEHQQAWYWLCRTDSMYCCSRVNLIYLDQAYSKIQSKMWVYILQSLKQFSMLRVLRQIIHFIRRIWNMHQVPQIKTEIPSSLQYKPHFSRQLNCWSLRCSWSIACRRCSNYIFILNLTPGFNGLGKDNYKMRREAFKFWDLVRLILGTLR